MRLSVPDKDLINVAFAGSKRARERSRAADVVAAVQSMTDREGARYLTMLRGAVDRGDDVGRLLLPAPTPPRPTRARPAAVYPRITTPG